MLLSYFQKLLRFWNPIAVFSLLVFVPDDVLALPLSQEFRIIIFMISILFSFVHANYLLFIENINLIETLSQQLEDVIKTANERKANILVEFSGEEAFIPHSRYSNPSFVEPSGGYTSEQIPRWITLKIEMRYKNIGREVGSLFLKVIEITKGNELFHIGTEQDRFEADITHQIIDLKPSTTTNFTHKHVIFHFKLVTVMSEDFLEKLRTFNQVCFILCYYTTYLDGTESNLSYQHIIIDTHKFKQSLLEHWENTNSKLYDNYHKAH